MIPLLLSFLMLTASAEWQEQTEKIPPLREEDVIAVILFEVGGLGEEDVEVAEIRQLEERAQVSVAVRGHPYSLKFVCRKTDFGPKWRLAEDLPAALKESAAGTDTAAEDNSAVVDQPDKDRPRLPKEGSRYREFLTGFFETLRASDEVDFADYYFRDDEFNYAASSEPQEKALQQVAEGRANFIEQCTSLREKLSGYEKFNVVSYFAGNVTRSTMAAVRALMPEAKVYFSSVSVEISADGQLGRITFEGVTLLGESWRIGAIAEVDLP